MPVMATTRAVRRSCSARWPDTPAPLPRHGHDQRQRVASGHGRGRRPHAPARGRGARTRTRRGRRGGTPAASPAVAEPDLPVPGGDPQEEEPAGRPLEEHRGGVEADHSWPRLGCPPGGPGVSPAGGARSEAIGGGGWRRYPRRRDHPSRPCCRCRAAGRRDHCVHDRRAADAGRAGGPRRPSRHADRQRRGRHGPAAAGADRPPELHRRLRHHPQARPELHRRAGGAGRGRHLDHGRRRPVPAGHGVVDLQPERADVRGGHPRRPDQRLLGGLGLLRRRTGAGPADRLRAPQRRADGEPGRHRRHHGVVRPGAGRHRRRDLLRHTARARRPLGHRRRQRRAHGAAGRRPTSRPSPRRADQPAQLSQAVERRPTAVRRRRPPGRDRRGSWPRAPPRRRRGCPPAACPSGRRRRCPARC